MTAPVHNTFFADPQGLNALRNGAKAQDPAALKEAAKQFESLFTQMLLKSMREANKAFGQSLFGNDQTEFYEDLFDQQLAVHLSKGRGLGLADMLVRQLQQGSGFGARGVGPEGESVRTHESPTSDVGKNTAKVSDTSLLSPKPQAPSPEPSRLDFIRQMRPYAEAAARELGVDANALLAQAALETGWGKSIPRTANGECSFNLFGIKAGLQWSGRTVNVPTLEFEDGIPVRKVERFRAYESPAECFRDYARLIGNSVRYSNAKGAGADVAAFAAALQDGGYATDPNYARKLVAVAEQVSKLAGQV